MTAASPGKPGKRSKTIGMVELSKDYGIEDTDIVFCVWLLMMLGQSKNPSYQLLDICETLRSKVYIRSTAARFCWYYRHGKFFPLRHEGKLYELYVEWCAAIGERANDKEWFGRVARHYNDEANFERIVRDYGYLEYAAANGRAENASSSGQALLDKLLKPAPRQRKRRAKKAA